MSLLPQRPRREKLLLLISAVLVISVVNTFGQEQRVLRVAADPNNLPFSNQRLEGFENKIAELIGRELHAKIEYQWRAQRRGFFRQTLKEGTADLVIGVPAHFDLALTTVPYYRSMYVFVTRKDRDLHIRSLDDERLHRLRIGVQLIGNDGVDTPPAHALAARGIVDNVVGFTLYGDYAQANPPARIIEAVEKSEVDVAVAWGPLAGFFSKQSTVPLELTPVQPQIDGPLRFAFDVAAGVRKNDRPLKELLDRILTEHRSEIDRVLESYNIPRSTVSEKKISAL